MRRLLRWLGWTLGGAILLGALLLGGGWWWLRQSLPVVDGEIQVAGLAAPVTVVRDRFAIPHVEAGSLLDATFALGFVHAQDRLWQMEFQRRVGAGRLAEMVGAAALPTDRFLRTLGMYRLAEASLVHLEPETVAWLEAYAAGVNAFLATDPWLPPEFLLLRHLEIEPWRPADSLVWIRMMAMDLAGNWQAELLRARLARLLTPEQIDDLFTPDRVQGPITLAGAATPSGQGALAGRGSPEKEAPHPAPSGPSPTPGGPRVAGDRSLPEAPEGLGIEGGPSSFDQLAIGRLASLFDRLAAVVPAGPAARAASNAWVVAGARSRTGSPLLANDPHLGMQAPGVWYLAHLDTPELDLIGASLPGVPGIVLGHNGAIAWGFTNTGVDTQDLFVERVDPSDPASYLTPDGSAPFEVREEVITIAGGGSETLRVRLTRHGPVLSDLLPASADLLGEDEVLALAWTALDEDDVSIQALLQLSQARDWDGFVDALRDVGSPMQNITYADRAGRIGFIAPGRVPVRRQGDGRWPVPGWSGDHDWIGRVPFEALPRAVDPPSGRLFNANNQIVPAGYPHLITADWELSYRARRIEQLLDQGDHDLATFAAMQADLRSLLAEDLLPLMLALAEPADPELTDALDRLRTWDRVMAADAMEPLLFAAWYRELSRLIHADELGPLFAGMWNLRPRFIERVLRSRQAWCDDVATVEREDCAQLARRALALALADLGARYGVDPEGWRWGDAHVAQMDHVLGKAQPLLAQLLDITLATGGDSSSVNVGHHRIRDERHPFRSVHAASYRGLYDLADLERSRFVASAGQSGHFLSPHYRDLARLWARGETVAMARQPAGFAPGAIGQLRLQPDRS